MFVEYRNKWIHLILFLPKAKSSAFYLSILYLHRESVTQKRKLCHPEIDALKMSTSIPKHLDTASQCPLQLPSFHLRAVAALCLLPTRSFRSGSWPLRSSDSALASSCSRTLVSSSLELCSQAAWLRTQLLYLRTPKQCGFSVLSLRLLPYTVAVPSSLF